MMKKAVPLSLLLASSALGQNNYAGTWTAPATPILPDATAKCCYYTGDVTVTGSSAVGKTNTASPASTAGTNALGTGPCGPFVAANQATASSASTDWTQPLTAVTGTSTNTGAAATTGFGTAAADFVITNNGLTLTMTPAKADTSGTCTGQAFTRAVYTISGVTSATGTPSTGTGTNCCFLDTTKTVTIAQDTNKRSTLTATFGSVCGVTGEQTQYLKAGSGGATGEIVVTDLSGQYKYTLSADKKTLTFVPATGTCSQEIAVNVNSSANKLAAMTSVVVAAAAVGLAVV